MNKYQFESGIEKLARVLSTAYNVRVVFEGEQAKTDGKTIFLPFIKNLDFETRKDINAYLDHEVGHIKFTDFKVLEVIKSQFFFQLCNACEDYRIENRMFDAFPGTYYNITPLNAKLIAKLEPKIAEYPWPYRLTFALSLMVADKPCVIDDEISDYVDYCEEFIDDLRNADSTKEVKDICELIYKRCLDKLEEKEEEKKTGKKAGPKGAKGEPGEPGKGRPLTKEEMEELKEHLAEAKSMAEKSRTDKDVIEERAKCEMDIHDMMDDSIEKKLKKEEKIKPSDVPDIGTGVVIPLTTRFDKVTDWTGKGDSAKYHKLRSSILHVIGPVKRHLERVLKVKENARWSYERERGKLNPSSFINLRTQLNYRRPFKEMTRVETKNVAVEILLDLSGSMGGHKIDCAQLAAIAMGESLRDLGIAFEVTGFNTKPCAEMRGLESKVGGVHSGRTGEMLDLYVFKDFISENMTGLTKIFSGVQNQDGECVVWACKRLMLRKETRKILIVMSDGQPASSDTESSLLRSDLKIKVEKIIKSGVECVGIGIHSDAVKYYYPEYVIVNDIEKLATEAMGQLSRIISRSRHA